MPKALITGITGQDGSYLAEHLLSLGYEVHGVVRRTSTLERSRLRHLYGDPKIYDRSLFLHYADLEDPTTLRRILVKVAPDEVYHLAGQSHVGLSFEIAESTVDSVAMGTLRLLEIIRDLPKPPRFFHAASSEIFGRPAQVPQDESTPMVPVNPYGAAKAFAAGLIRIYREKHGLFLVNGILYNHESPRRGENFVTRKICRAAAAISLGRQDFLSLGDTSAQRDWGDARDYVQGMWLALQHRHAEDFVFATGVLHTVQELVETAFGVVGLDWEKYVRRDERLLRSQEPLALVGNATKAEHLLGWRPGKDLQSLVRWMVEADLRSLSSG
ncbi:MAG TPA: GDP-mannose 4,6-dehydratase [Candidatus Limnocylindria bacterium]|jgi:GDPmannose 4,6-dehydratase|nr:GDP-mannose 4,6-dehydratase [Candidatus Limnocylindria bacterium]